MRLGTFAAIILAVTAVLLPAPSYSQQTSEQRLRAAQRDLRRIDRDERFDVSSSRCRSAIDDRQAIAASTWCQVASQEAENTRRREHRTEHSAAESNLLLDAAWLVAVKGVQQRASPYSRPLLRNVAGDDATRLRIYAYQLLGDIRCNCAPSRSLPILLFALGVPPADYETYAQGRERALTTALAQSLTPERLWAAAALAHTVGMDISPDVERMRAEARTVALLLAPMIAEATELSGRDAALAPLLIYAQGLALVRANDLQGALTVLEPGILICERTLWTTADVCLDMAVQAAQSRESLAAQQADSGWSEQTPSVATSHPIPEPFDTDEPCAALLAGDIDEAGALINVRVAYASSGDFCRSYALRYAAGLRYSPASLAKPDERRRNNFVRLTVHPE